MAARNPIVIGTDGLPQQIQSGDFIPIAGGGTGATTALGARQSLGARGAGVLAKTAAYTVLATDVGKFIPCTGSFALTLPAAASAGNGFAIEVKNEGTGVVGLTPNAAAQTIDGLTALNLYPGECCTLLCDGSVWRTFGLSTGPVLLSSATLSSTAAAQFTRFDPARFANYLFVLNNVLPSADNNFLLAQISNDKGSTFKGGSTDYTYAYTNTLANGSSGIASSGGGNTSLVMANALSSAQALGGQVWVMPGALTAVDWNLKATSNSGPQLAGSVGSGQSAYVASAVQFLLAGGNFTSGGISMCGMR